MSPRLQTICDTLSDQRARIIADIERFAKKYGLIVEVDSDHCAQSLVNAVTAAQDNEGEQRLVVVTIDEYDRLSRHCKLSKTADGPPELQHMRSLFIALKDAPADLCFITGVMPLLMVELSSAANDVTVITHEEEYAEAVGLPQIVVNGELRRIATWIYGSSRGAAADREAYVATLAPFVKVSATINSDRSGFRSMTITLSTLLFSACSMGTASCAP